MNTNSPKIKKFLPFGYKLMLSYCLFIIIPLVVVVSIANSIYVTSIREQTRNNINGTLQQIKDNIAYRLESMTRVTDLLYHDRTLAKYLKQYEEGWISYETTTTILKPKFSKSIDSTNYDIWLSFYLHNETLPEIYYDHRNGNPLEKIGRVYEQYHIKRIKDKDWYREFPPEEYGITLQWKQIEDDEAHGRISLLRRIVDEVGTLNLKEIGFVRIAASLSDLFHSVDYQKIGEGSSIFIVGEDGQIRYLSGEDVGQLDDAWEDTIFEEHLVIQDTLPGLNWTLVTLVPNEIMEKDVQKVRTMTVIICAICILVFFFIGGWITGYFSKRVNKIVSVLNAFREGEFHKRMTYRGNDEFAQITHALNEMGKNTEGLIREVYLTNIQKKEAELETLQAQINPHFLYNTLSSISRLSKFGEGEKLQHMVLDLAKFYRLTLNEGRTIIPIAKELEQAEAYLNIQKIKYDDRMEVLLDINPEICKYDTIKLILQPLIENVLEHAWFADRIHIRIVGDLAGDDIIFKVIDDGVGIPADLIKQLLDPKGNLNIGYGIRNVDQRIKLHFGKEYGLSIYSKLGMGTSVVIKLPVSREK